MPTDVDTGALLARLDALTPILARLVDAVAAFPPPPDTTPAPPNPGAAPTLGDVRAALTDALPLLTDLQDAMLRLTAALTT